VRVKTAGPERARALGGRSSASESRLDASASTIAYAIVVGRFYGGLAERLIAGAQEAFAQAGHADVEVFDVPGAFELPLAASYAAKSGRFAGLACLGAVIRGETDHYDFVCAETARGVMQVQLDTGVPCAFGVLTCETMEQALERSGGGKRDQGRHAAEAVMAMTALRAELSGAPNVLPGHVG
jgi:6,7-dimethyl-8-ribityllumazine synthase